MLHRTLVLKDVLTDKEGEGGDGRSQGWVSLGNAAYYITLRNPQFTLNNLASAWVKTNLFLFKPVFPKCVLSQKPFYHSI